MFAAHLRRLFYLPLPITSSAPPNPRLSINRSKSFAITTSNSFKNETFNSNSNPYPYPKVVERSRRMASSNSNDPASNPKLAKLRGLIAEDASGGWEKCWEEGLTPWDMGQPTPILTHLLQTGVLPKGRVLIPGCGTGYDVVALASLDRYVIGLDVSETAMKKAKEWSSSAPNTSYFTFLAADFFTYDQSQLFDLIFDYTFFCAIDPCLRSAWAKKISDILKPDGELITLMFPVDDQKGGPPYSVNVADYEEVLNPFGIKALSIVDNELAIEHRKGREKLGRWKRCQSSL